MKKKTLWMLVSGVVALSLVLASCGPAVEEEEEVVTEEKEEVVTEEKEEVVTEEKEEVVTEEKEEVVAAPEEPQYGGTLSILAPQCRIEPLSWDPGDVAYTTNCHCGFYMEQLLVGDLQKGPRGENIYSFRPSAGVPEAAMRGEIAESWEVPDPLTIIFHIRKGILWQNKPGVMGARELTAHDLAFSFNRLLASPKLPSGPYDWIDSVVATDDYTLVFNGNRFYADWPYAIGWGYYVQLYPPELVDAGIDDWRNAVGSGPFMLTDYVRGSSLTYERNPNYWDTTTINGEEYQIPFVDRVFWVIMPDTSTQVAALRTGKVDINMPVSMVNAESLKETNPELAVWEHISDTGSCIGMRMDNPELPFHDRRVRRAMAMAIDYQAVIDSLYGGEGDALQFTFLEDWGEELYTPMEKLPESVRELFEYNPEEAKRLLTEAGYPDGFKTEIVSANYGTLPDLLSMYADYWSKIGIDCNIKLHEYGSFMSIWYQRKHEQMIHYTLAQASPTKVCSYHVVAENKVNSSAFDDPHARELFDRAMETIDLAKRNAIFKELNVYFLDQCPVIPVPLAYSYCFAWPWVKNYYGEISVGTLRYAPIFARIWLDQELKKEMGY